VPDGGSEQSHVVDIEAGDGILDVDSGVGGEACGQEQDASSRRSRGVLRR
jgi:hypothetical protein